MGYELCIYNHTDTIYSITNIYYKGLITICNYMLSVVMII